MNKSIYINVPEEIWILISKDELLKKVMERIAVEEFRKLLLKYFVAEEVTGVVDEKEIVRMDDGLEEKRLFCGRWESLWEVGLLSELIVYIDKKGRVLIPSSIRKRLNIRNVVKIVVEEGQIVLKPVEDPLKRVERLVVKGTDDVEAEIRKLHKISEDELRKDV